MNTPSSKITLLLASAVLLAHPLSISANEKKPSAAASASVSDRGARARINDGCMTNAEARAVARAVAQRRQRQDEEVKRYEMFKFEREIALARATASNIIIESGLRSSRDAEAPAKAAVTTAELRAPEASNRLAAEDAAQMQDEQAVLRLTRYPAEYFRKLAEEKDSDKRVSEQVREDEAAFALGEQGSITGVVRGESKDLAATPARAYRAQR